MAWGMIINGVEFGSGGINSGIDSTNFATVFETGFDYIKDGDIKLDSYEIIDNKIVAKKDSNLYILVWEYDREPIPPTSTLDSAMDTIFIPIKRLSWKKVVQNCADAYRETTGTNEKVKAKELPKLISNMPKKNILPNGKYWFRNSNWGTTGITSITYGNGIYLIATSNSGGVLFSRDNGQTWIKTNFKDSSELVYYANGMYFVVSGDPNVPNSKYGLYYSTNATSWTKTDIESDSMIYISYGKGVYVIATSSGFSYSKDGEKWNSCNFKEEIIKDNFNYLLYIEGFFVAGTDETSRIFYSLNGIDWFSLKNDFLESAPPLNNVNYVNGYITGGCSYTRTMGLKSENICYGEIKLFDADLDKPLPDIKFYTSDPTKSLYSPICYGKKVYVAGAKITSPSPEQIEIIGKGIIYSTDLKRWEKTNITEGTFKNIQFYNGIFVAAGYNGLYYSYNGKEWFKGTIKEGKFDIIYCANSLMIAGGHATKESEFQGPGIYQSPTCEETMPINYITTFTFRGHTFKGPQDITWKQLAEDKRFTGLRIAIAGELNQPNAFEFYREVEENSTIIGVTIGVLRFTEEISSVVDDYHIFQNYSSNGIDISGSSSEIL